MISSSPSVAGGYVYFGSDDGVIYQLNATDFSSVANFTTNNGSGYSAHSSAAIANGYIYIGSHDYNLYQLNANNISLPNNITSNCTPNWTCDIYFPCLPNNTMPCQTMADLNFCGTNFTGNISDYNINCTYTLPSNLTAIGNDITSAGIDTGVKIIVGFGNIAYLLGIILTFIGAGYVFIKKVIMKK